MALTERKKNLIKISNLIDIYEQGIREITYIKCRSQAKNKPTDLHESLLFHIKRILGFNKRYSDIKQKEYFTCCKLDDDIELMDLVINHCTIKIEELKEKAKHI